MEWSENKPGTAIIHAKDISNVNIHGVTFPDYVA